MIAYSLNHTSAANVEMIEIEKIIINNFKELLKFLFDLAYSARDEIAKSKDEILKEQEKRRNWKTKIFSLTVWKSRDHKPAKEAINKLERKITSSLQFFKDADLYVQSVKKNLKDLEKILDSLHRDFSQIEETLENDKKLIVDIEAVDMSPDIKDQFIKDVDRTVKEIYEQSCLLIKKIQASDPEV